MRRLAPVRRLRSALLRIVLSALVAVVVLHLRAQPVPKQPAQTVLSVPADRAADSYAIYSMLLPGDPFQSMSPEQTQHLGIADTTVSINEMNPAIPPNGQLQPPPDNPKAFREALGDFQSRRFERFRLTRALKLDRDYQLLTPVQVGELKNVRTGIDPGSSLQDKYAGYAGITFFSEVYFNSAHTAALVYMNNVCANLCANGTWIYLEKRDGAWVRRSGLNV